MQNDRNPTTQAGMLTELDSHATSQHCQSPSLQKGFPRYDGACEPPFDIANHQAQHCHVSEPVRSSPCLNQPTPAFWQIGMLQQANSKKEWLLKYTSLEGLSVDMCMTKM